MLQLTLITSNGIWDIIPNLKTAISLAAFALAVVLSVMLAWFKSNRRRIPTAFWVVVVALVLIGVMATLYKPDELYRVRVTVLSPEQVPVEDAKVWSSLGGEPKKVAGGWQFDIPDASKPLDGQLAIFASRESAFLAGKADLVLSNDYNLAVTIRLRRDDSAKVRGQVVDSKGRAVAGARVVVIGYENEAVITKEGGNFELPAHAATGQQLKLYAEKAGIGAATQPHPAGDAPVELMLER
jgi:hypothetical protein